MKYIMLWVPAHVGIERNEEADRMFKNALKQTDIDVNRSLSEAEMKE